MGQKGLIAPGLTWFPSCWKGPANTTPFSLWAAGTGNIQVLAESMKRMWGKEPAGGLVLSTSISAFLFKKSAPQTKNCGKPLLQGFFFLSIVLPSTHMLKCAWWVMKSQLLASIRLAQNYITHFTFISLPLTVFTTNFQLWLWCSY